MGSAEPWILKVQARQYGEMLGQTMTVIRHLDKPGENEPEQQNWPAHGATKSYDCSLSRAQGFVSSQRSSLQDIWLVSMDISCDPKRTLSSEVNQLG